MKKKSKQPLMRKTHLPLLLLGAAMTLYGLVTALVSAWLSKRAMLGVLSAGAYRARLASFEGTASLIAGIAFLALFIWCAVASKGIARVAFCFGAVAALPTMLIGREKLLPVPSAFSGPVVALLVAIPMVVMFILLACGGWLPRSCRWTAFACIFIVLFAALFPVYVLLAVTKIPVGSPLIVSFGKLVDVSTNVIRLRYLLPGLAFLLMAYFSLHFARKMPGSASLVPAAPEGESQ
jgi:hypothetical protein